MPALEFEQEEEEVEEEEHGRLLDGPTGGGGGGRSTNGGGKSNGSSSRRSSGAPNSYLPLRTTNSSSYHLHHHQRRRHRYFIFIVCIISVALLFIAARYRNNYNNSTSGSSGSNIYSSSSSSWPWSSSSDSDNHPLPPPLFNQTFATYLTSGLIQILAANNGTTKHYIYDSPYELRYPDSKQPYWARKTIPYNKRMKPEQQICLVHVGKAGGSTLGCMLGFSLHCDDNTAAAADANSTIAEENDGGGGGGEEENDKTKTSQLQIKGLLPIATTHVFHRGVNDCADVAAYYLFVIRDPLARILSAFNYERPNMTKTVGRYKNLFMGKELYEECGFWTLEELTQRGLLSKEVDESSLLCQSRAYEAITGIGGYLCHGYFNYQYYAQSVFETQDALNGETVIPHNANLLVIRNDHIVDDWNNINLMIGGQPEDAIQSSDIPMNNAHAKNATELYLSDASKTILCEVLCNEIQIYKDIIRRAINFNHVDVMASFEELRQTCPKEAVEETCSEERPNFHNRIERMKGELG